MEKNFEQIEEVRKQIINQIRTAFPEDRRDELITKISSMSETELIDFLKENNASAESEEDQNNCIFCSIISGAVQSVKIEENDNAVAILEINPLSEGHTIIIPREHSGIIDKKIEDFSEEISKQIKKTLKPKEIVVKKGSLFGHQIINLIPVYGDSPETQRKKVSTDELNTIKDKITFKVQEKPKPIEINNEIETISEKTIIPKRKP
jgi:histidine triad (HIT) family protein